MDYQRLAKKAEDYAPKVNAKGVNAKCGEKPKDKDSGWEFLLQW